MEKKKTDAECIYEEIEQLVSTGPEPDIEAIMTKVVQYGAFKYGEGIEDAIEADVHPDIEEAMSARAEALHEARMEVEG